VIVSIRQMTLPFTTYRYYHCTHITHMHYHNLYYKKLNLRLVIFKNIYDINEELILLLRSLIVHCRQQQQLRQQLGHRLKHVRRLLLRGDVTSCGG